MFAGESAVADGYTAKQCTEYLQKVLLTFILGISSLARHRQCNLNQPLCYHGKGPFDLSSLEMGA